MGRYVLKLDTYSNEAALVGRIFFSSLFVLYGYFNITSFAGTTAYMARQGLPAPALFAAPRSSSNSAAVC